MTEEPGAKPEPIRSVARRLLGLNETDAETLFDANDTRDYVLGSLADYIDTGQAQERAAASEPCASERSSSPIERRPPATRSF